MDIKGFIDQDVYIRGKIKQIIVNATGTEYDIEIEGDDGWKTMKAEDVVIPETTRCDYYETPEKKGPGRPKKATTEDLIRKMKQVNIAKQKGEDE